MNSLDDKVRHLLDLPVTDKPDVAFGRDFPIARRVIVGSYEVNGYDSYEIGGLRVGIKIRVTPQDTKPYYEPPYTTFKVSYPSSYNGKEHLEGLRSFIESMIGQEIYIVYIPKIRSGVHYAILHMILTTKTNQLFVKGDRSEDVLVPYLPTTQLEYRSK